MVPSLNIFSLIISILSLYIHCPEGSLSGKSFINILISFERRVNKAFLMKTSYFLVLMGFFISLSISSIVFGGSFCNFLYVYFILPLTTTFLGEFFISNLSKIFKIFVMFLLVTFNSEIF